VKCKVLSWTTRRPELRDCFVALGAKRRCASGLAMTFFTLEASNLTLSASDQLRQTNPILGRPEGRLTAAGERSYDELDLQRALEKQSQFGKGVSSYPTIPVFHHSTIPARGYSRQTNPIRPEPKESQVPYDKELTSDSSRNGRGKTNPICPAGPAGTGARGRGAWVK
jgi:hypothetical protein